MKKILAVLLLALLFSWQCLAETGLPNNRLFMRRLGFARTLAEVDQIVEEARKLDSDYREAFSKTAEWRQKLRETDSWFPDILISANFRRRELLLKIEKRKPIAELMQLVFDESFSIHERILFADAVLAKSSELTKSQKDDFVKKMTKLPDSGLRTWAYAKLSALVRVDEFIEEIKKGLLDTSPDVVASAVLIVYYHSLRQFYGLLYYTVQANSGAAMGNSCAVLREIGAFGSACIPFLASISADDTARGTITCLFIKTINVLFAGQGISLVKFEYPDFKMLPTGEIVVIKN